MKQLIILLLIIIAGVIGFGKYQDYKRYNSPEVDYSTDKKIDLEYYNQELVINYHKAVADVNSFVKLQWSANGIDVRTPEEDNEETKVAVANYAKKLGTLQYFENKLNKSLQLKEKGLSNKEIQFLEETGTDFSAYQKNKEIAKIKSMFNDEEKLRYGQTSALIFEIQKKLVKKGHSITIDGIYRAETKTAIKAFEEKNNLFSDGFLDVLTLDALFK